MGTDGIYPSALRELEEVLTFHHLSAVLPIRGGPSQLAASKCDAHLQEVRDGGSGKLQACQSDLGAREARGADYLERHHTALAEQPDDQAQSAWVYQRQVLLDEPDLLL